MTTHAVKIDRSKSLAEEPATGHNRWHEGIPPIVEIQPGDQVVLETRDALDGQITPRRAPPTSAAPTSGRPTR